MTASWVRLTLSAGLAAALGSFLASPGDAPERTEALEQQLRATETAFAQTMADRDHAAFSAMLSDEAIFFGGTGPLRGKQAVASAWSRFFEGEKAPFSWEPEVAVVLESGTLGLTSGPVRDPDGNRIGTFNSVWRRAADGAWKVVLDRGCECR